MQQFNDWMSAVNAVLWHDAVLFIILGTGVLFTVWSGFSQWRAVTHGAAVVRGRYDDRNDPGAINHFQALSTALSATVGLGNIGGVAIAISLGGPGAVFWMWIVGFVGMALKTTEVTLSMLYRDTSDPENPRGGPMWVASRGLPRLHPSLRGAGQFVGAVFCVTVLISAVTGGNMFQAWNVGLLTERYFGVPGLVTGAILALVVGSVIIGGIRRIGAVAGRIVPLMCVLYLLAALYVVLMRLGDVPAMLRLIVVSAFTPAEAQGAFLGGTAGFAFLWGMKRALFSNEAGQGSAPIAHAAAKTDEPVREGVVAGLEPFIDTLVVCTLTTLVILLSGAWNRGPEVRFETPPAVARAAGTEWTLETPLLPLKEPAQVRISEQWKAGDTVFMRLHTDPDEATASDLHRLPGVVRQSAVVTLRDGATVEGRLRSEGADRLEIDVAADGGTARRVLLTDDVRAIDRGQFMVEWGTVTSARPPRADDPGVYVDYVGAYLTGHAFDRVQPGLGRWLVTLAAWLFAVSTIISWSYYGEQGIVFLAGARAVLPYKVVYCLLILVATAGFLTRDDELDNLTGIGTGVMLFANIPIMLLFGYQAMAAYRDYIGRLDSGAMAAPHEAPRLVDVARGRDVQ
jgi:alanine or glycine:cation symporter, AGCS family